MSTSQVGSRVMSRSTRSIVAVRDKWSITVKEERRGHQYSVPIEQVINKHPMYVYRAGITPANLRKHKPFVISYCSYTFY